ncbi:MAG: histidine biosynthesis bifunctional protein HisB [Bacteroidia bacterium]|nr:MAG: histidine biosynthesis bifunctional protein HisB [Bacteroidia bacterium]
MPYYLFVDRDGTLLEEPPDTQQIDSYERFRLLAGVLSTLRWAVQMGYRLVMITNQDGLGTPAFPEERFWGPQRLLLDICESEGIRWTGIHIDRSRSDQPSPYRKPSPLLLLPYLEGSIDRQRSFVIGDRYTDMRLAERIGVRGLWLENPLHPLPQGWPASTDTYQRVANWAEIQRLLQERFFFTELHRTTTETQVHLQLAVYGQGEAQVCTGIGFLDHMFTLLAHHAGWTLTLQAQGDLEVDLHHTLEDVGIALGQALARLLEDKRGLARYGQSGVPPICRALPMDEALALVAVDLSGRGGLRWEVALSEAVGGASPTLWRHFFETLAREGRFTLHLWAQGLDSHHLLEAVFKGLGRALRQAFQRDYSQPKIPSTKGSL